MPAPRAAQPTKQIFDPFNSSATGHQRAENRLSGSTLWRNSRHTKLREQFTSGAGGGKRVADTVGAGSDGSMVKRMGLKENGTVTWTREEHQLSLQECLKVGKRVDGEDEDGGGGGERKRKRIKLESEDVEDEKNKAADLTLLTPATKTHKHKAERPQSSSPSDLLSPIDPNTSSTPPTSQQQEVEPEAEGQSNPSAASNPPLKQIFANLTFYINGSTAPLVSDHHLKRTLASHGARVSIALGRRTVTHVILGRPGSSGGFGGGALSGSKLQREIARKCAGESVKYVTVEWVLESVKAGKRLPETRFEAVRLAPKGVGSVRDMFEKAAKSGGGKG